jgi:hypothetical protein
MIWKATRRGRTESVALLGMKDEQGVDASRTRMP